MEELTQNGMLFGTFFWYQQMLLSIFEITKTASAKKWKLQSGAYQGRGKGTMPQVPNHLWHRKVPPMSQVLSSIQYICSQNTLGLNMGAPILFLALGTI